jgi:ATP-dependent DNA ligase
MRTAAWGFGEDDDLKAILRQFAALLVRPAPGCGADRRVVGQSLVCSVAVGSLRRVRESMRRLRRVRHLRRIRRWRSHRQHSTVTRGSGSSYHKQFFLFWRYPL